jgi:hypothetical protein
MRDTAEAISRDTDVPLDWVRGSLDDVLRHDGVTTEQAYRQVRAAYEATFHALAHRWMLAIEHAIHSQGRRVHRSRT